MCVSHYEYLPEVFFVHKSAWKLRTFPCFWLFFFNFLNENVCFWLLTMKNTNSWFFFWLLRRKKMRYVLITWSVVSRSGNRVTTCSICFLLKACGLRVTSIKIGTSSLLYVTLSLVDVFTYVEHLISRSLYKYWCWNHVSVWASWSLCLGRCLWGI